MKNILALLMLTFFTLSLNAQEKEVDAITQFFSEYQESEDFSSVYISPKMFQMFAGMDTENKDEELTRILNSIKGLRILSTDNDGTQLYKKSKALLTDNSYELLMNVKEEDNDVEFLIKDGSDGKIKELLLLVGGVEGFTMLSFIGDISLQDLSKLGSKMDINGLEYLDQLEDK